MSKLQYKIITDPEEFVKTIRIDQNDYLYIYQEDIFEPNDNIYTKLCDTYEKYIPAIMFTDIISTHNGVTSNQYFQDIINGGEKRIIYSPLSTRFLAHELMVYPTLKYHSFSFLMQLIHKGMLPWHVPNLGFDSDLDDSSLNQLSQDTQWVTQHVIS